MLSGAVRDLNLLGTIGRSTSSSSIHGVLIMGHPNFLSTLLNRPLPVMGADFTVDSLPIPLSEASEYRLVFMHKRHLPENFDQY